MLSECFGCHGIDNLPPLSLSHSNHVFFYETALFKNEFNRTLTDVNQTSAALLLLHFQSNTAKATEAEERDTTVCNFLSK